MSCKFGKNRSVDPLYLNVPIKYITNYDGANTSQKYKAYGTEEAFRDLEKKYPELYDKWNKTFFNSDSKETKQIVNNIINYLIEKAAMKNTEKTLCIIDFYGKHFALVAWRNSHTMKMGMTRLCRIKSTKDGVYLLYKNAKIEILKSAGWVF